MVFPVVEEKIVPERDGAVAGTASAEKILFLKFLDKTCVRLSLHLI